MTSRAVIQHQRLHIISWLWRTQGGNASIREFSNNANLCNLSKLQKVSRRKANRKLKFVTNYLWIAVTGKHTVPG